VSAEPPRHFTPAEAEALLPEIDRLLEAAQALVARIDALARPPSPQANGHIHVNGRAHAESSSEIDPIRAELQRVVDQIESQGVIVRDVRTGLIDFRSIRDGRTIFLCWRRGEPLRIEWWHPTSTGIAGRRRL